MLSRFVIAFFPRSKHLLISWLQSSSAVILEPPQMKVSQCFHCFPIYLPWSDGTRCHDLHFMNVELQMPLSTFTIIKRLFSSSSLFTIRGVSSAYLMFIFLVAIQFTSIIRFTRFTLIYVHIRLHCEVLGLWPSTYELLKNEIPPRTPISGRLLSSCLSRFLHLSFCFIL